jgi:hypothetical protein
VTTLVGVTTLEIRWTKRRPKKTGIYLYRDSSASHDAWTVVEVTELFGRFEVEYLGTEQTECLERLHGFWSLLRERTK